MIRRMENNGEMTQRPNADKPSFWPEALPRSLAIALLWCSVAGALTPPSPMSGTSGAVEREDRWKVLGNGVLEDTRTKHEWSQNDNGSDIDWQDAKSYCEVKHHGWRLPSAQELRSIYDEHEHGVQCAHAVCKVTSQFHLTGDWFWSATQVGKDATDGIELAWGVVMANGAQTQAVREASYGSRVLCVRDP